jgi:hypothetical protein
MYIAVYLYTVKGQMSSGHNMAAVCTNSTFFFLDRLIFIFADYIPHKEEILLDNIIRTCGLAVI